MTKTVDHITLDDLHGRLLAEIPNGASVLDVGAGLAKYHELIIPPRTSILTLVDAHRPYVKDRVARFPEAEVFEGEALPTLLSGRFASYIWDVALGIDFIEHLEVDEARATIRAMQKVTRKVILFTPEGNHPQNTDHYGMGGDHWQTHRSTWVAQDFEDLGFEVERWADFHRWTVDRGCDPGAIWAVWRKP